MVGTEEKARVFPPPRCPACRGRLDRSSWTSHRTGITIYWCICHGCDVGGKSYVGDWEAYADFSRHLEARHGTTITGGE